MIARDVRADASHHDDDDTDELELLEAAAATDVRLYDATDLPWIAIVLDHVMSCVGQPWRVLRERLDHSPIRGVRVAAILVAMRRMMDGRAQRTKVARKVRAAVLGQPALDDDSRTQRLAKAGDELGIEPSEIESLLWIDLADERPVTLPSGRPEEHRLAAYANVDRIQRALRRAKHVRIHAWGNAHPLIRTAARYGLLVRVSAARTRDAFAARDALATCDALTTRDALATRDHTIIDIVGPLSLFHQTSVYGRSLGAVVPLLSGLDRFVVEIDADFGYGMAALRVTSPALLPPAPTNERGRPSIAAKIASAMGSVRDVLVELDPPPIAHASDRLFPDLALELVGPTSVSGTEPTRDASGANRDASGANRNASGANRNASEANRNASGANREEDLEDDRDLIPDLAALLASQMTAEADRIAPRVIAGALPRNEPDRSRCWFVEVVGFATAEYLTAKLARYRAAGIDRVVLVVDETRDASLDSVGTSDRRVVAYRSKTVVADLLAIIAEAK